MKKLTAGLLSLFISFAAFSEGEQEHGESQGTGSRSFNYSGFTAVDTGYGIDVEIAQSASYSVKLYADPDVIDTIVVETAGRTLRIYMRWEFPRSLFSWGWGGDARVEISMPTLEGLSASGGSRVTVDMDDEGGEIQADLSGGSSLVGTLRTGRMEIHGSGGSSVRLSGGCGHLTLEGSGGATYRLYDFSAEDLDADLSGGSSAEAMVVKTMNVRASGGAHMYYRGDPRVEKQVLSGGAWIRQT